MTKSSPRQAKLPDFRFSAQTHVSVYFLSDSCSFRSGVALAFSSRGFGPAFDFRFMENFDDFIEPPYEKKMSERITGREYHCKFVSDWILEIEDRAD